MPTELEQIVTPELQIEARLCSEVINRMTGHSWKRDLDPRSRWVQLYHRAVLNPKEFECIMDEESPFIMQVEGDKGLEARQVFTVNELEGCSMPKLREIGKLYGAKSTRKKDLIVGILNAQSQLIMKAKVENLPRQG